MYRRVRQCHIFLPFRSFLQSNDHGFIIQGGVFQSFRISIFGRECQISVLTRYSRPIAGRIMTFPLLLLIDVSTFFVTITTTFIVRQGIKVIQPTEKQSFLESIKEGWSAIHVEKGVFVLVLCSSLITLFLGTLQILVEPMILLFQTPRCWAL